MKKIIASLVLAVMLMPSTSFAVSPEEQIAQLKATLNLQATETAAENCQQALVPLYDLEMIDFLRFLEQNFENKSSTTSLSNTAIARYSKFKQRIQAEYNNVSPGLNRSDAENVNIKELEALSQCSKITDTYLDLAKQQMIKYIKKTSADKKATIMVEKYQAINNQLRELNLKVAKMYGYFMSFKSKLPGFLQQCVTI